MAGNSQRRGAMRKPGTKKGAVVGIGRAVPARRCRAGVRRRRRRCARATRRPDARRAAADASGQSRGAGPPGRGKAELPETVVGRNPVVEALRAGVPATALYVAAGWPPTSGSPRRSPAPANGASRCSRSSRPELDRLTGNAIHQGLALVGAAVPVRAPGGPAGPGQGLRPRRR